MKQTLASFIILLPLIMGIALLDVGARMLYGPGSWEFFQQLWAAEIGGDWTFLIILTVLGMIVLLAAGALYSLVWSNAWMMGGNVKPHIFLGENLSQEQTYVAEDDPSGEPFAVWVGGGSSRVPTTGFTSIYLSHLLVQFPFTAGKWQHLRELTTVNMIWPIIIAPIVYFMGQMMVWAGLVIAHENGLKLRPQFVDSAGELPLALLGEVGIWPLAVCGVMTIILVPLALRTGRWAGEVYERFGREAGGPVPKALPLPEGVGDGDILQGEIIDTARWTDGDSKNRRQYRAFLMRFEEPFEPPVVAGFYFRNRRKRKAFLDYLEERQAAGMPIKVRLAGKHHLTLIPLAADGGNPPDGIAEDIMDLSGG